MDTKTKKAKKTAKPAKKSPKQAIARIGSLLKGIDNSVFAISKHKSVVNDAVKEVRSLMSGLSNGQTTPAKPEAKKIPAKPVKKATPKKAEAKKVPAKPVKKAEAKKVPAKAEAKKPEKEEKKPALVKPGKPVDGRPSLKEAVRQIITANGDRMTAAEIWKQATTKWGYWSRQSLYNVLKDEKSFARQGDQFVLQHNTVDDVEADKFITQVENSQAVSSVQ